MTDSILTHPDAEARLRWLRSVQAESEDVSRKSASGDGGANSFNSPEVAESGPTGFIGASG